MRAMALGLLVAASLGAAAAPAALAEPVTTRIETRPFYGATVTLEEGVRVFRPLPRHDRVIINPGGRTPLSLSYAESRNTSYYEGNGARPPVEQRYDPGDDGYYGGFVSDGRHRRHGHGRGHGHRPASRR
ncbi:MAG: hypothetical protein K2X43_06695 [Hyphomonadaceae bacterium]|nr:hypothetical protein [Hyphomonadaceae bacterium]